jgi:hypothetical protein
MKSLLMPLSLLSLFVASHLAATARPAAAADAIGFVETFALAEDRSKVLEQLIPGTEDYYFYHALYYQNSGQAGKLKDILAKWRKRVKSSNLRDLIERRERLFAYDNNPKETLNWLRHELALHFSHQREKVPGQKPNLPTSLDPKSISRDAFISRVTRHNNNLSGFQNSALDWILREGGVELNSGRRRALLSRIDRPDYDKLVELILADFRTKESRGFGEFNIHRALLLNQMNALVESKPDLRANTNFINAYLTKLAPDADADLNVPQVRRDHMQRMWTFVKGLAPAQNTLKAHVLYSLLDHQRKAGRYDRALFVTYVKLPRPMPYVQPKYLQRVDVRRYQVNLSQDFAAFTQCRPVHDDTALVRDYLLHFLASEDDFQPWTEWLRDTFVKPLMAEAKIVSGAADPERWTSMLSPAAYQALKDRVDIDLAVINPQKFAMDDEVKLWVDMKNVKKLRIKIYQVNAFNVYLATNREVSTGLALDGLVAGAEKEHAYKESPFRRVRREFTFPELKGKRGVWMIELIGGGRSSRALIRKGYLHYLSRQGVGGTVLSILDEADQPVRGASAWLAGREYKADKDGGITIPYSTRPSRKPIILRAPDSFSSLAQFQHAAENYTLTAGFFVDRETLRVGSETSLMVRPDFRINGVAAPLDILEEIKLTITSTNLEGVATTQEIPGFELHRDKESVHKFAVPPRLSTLSFQLEAKVEQVSTGRKIPLAAASARQINAIDRSEPTFDLHLSRMDGHAVLEVLGKTGERLADRAVRITIEHSDFKGSHSVSLKSDAGGRIDLGELPNIARITASSPGTNNTSWHIAAGEDAHSRPAVLHAVQGETIHVPHLGAEELSRAVYSLLDQRGGTFTQDHFDNLALEGGFLAIQDLARGDYNLKIKREGRVIPIRVTAGKMIGRFAAGKRRILETANHLPLHITDVVEGKEGGLVVHLVNVDKGTRVHVLAARFDPVFPLRGSLGGAYQPPFVMLSRATFGNLYLSGRDIGDEYRYILERREQDPFPGNMLVRPGLLLNPWAIRDTDTGKQQAVVGGEYADKPGGSPAAATAAEGEEREASGTIDDPSNLDFLIKSGVVLVNLVPDKEGIVRIPQDKLADRQDIHIVAIGPTDTAFRRVSLPDAGAKFRDLRLARPLEIAKHFTQRKEVALLNQGGRLAIPDVRAAEMQAYDTLGSVYSLHMTLTQNPTLAEFGFLLDWNTLEDEEKRAKYSKYASHELNFFLSRKDPKFYQKVIHPYLRNKKGKTFMDHYLLGDAVDGFVDPWRYSRLNMAERVLLAHRLGGAERSVAKRHLSELFDLIPPNPAVKEYLFATALRGRSLSPGGGMGGGGGGQFGFEGAAGEKVMEESASLGARFRADRGAMVLSDGTKTASAGRPLSNEQSKQVARRSLGQNLRMNEKKEALGKARAKNGRDYAEFGLDDDKDSHQRLDLARRQGIRGFYRKLPKVKEWAENNYYQVLIQNQLADLVNINAFWRDYAVHLADGGDAPFLSEHIAVPTSNFSEMMLALAVLDLPTKAGEHATEQQEAAYKIEAASPTIVFHKQIQEVPVSGDKTPVLVGQNFFRHGDRYLMVDGEKRDKYVTYEFLRGVVYGCQVVVTNPTSATQKLDILVQIPEKAMPVLGSKRTRSLLVQLGPYATQKLEYYFYFPKTGDLAHYPVHVARDETATAWADPFEFHVVERLSKIDKASWAYISQWGTSAEVLAYLHQNNVHRIDLGKIAWRMRDLDFFNKSLELLAKRHAFHPVLWSYGIYHNRLPRIQEFLRNNDGYLRRFGDYVACTLATVDPVERHWYQHLEYSALVNARAHRLGRDRKIVNSAFRNQYTQLMNVLRYKVEPNDEDELDVVYYLFLQDRVAEALSWFDKVDAEELPSALQIDYMRCYVAFYRERPQNAKRIATGYSDHPVDKWRERFANVISQAAEIGGSEVAESNRDEDNREGLQDKLASTEPALEMKVENREVRLTFQNLEQVTVNCYEMDLEFLFSTNPFVESGGERFGVIKPNYTTVVRLPKKGDTHSFSLPGKFAGKNVLVEVLGSGRRVAQAYYANSLKVQLVQQYGRLQVRHAETGRPLAKVYVKVYAKTPTGTRFFKDGYTDLRGKFDYTSLNTDDMGGVSEFAVLVMSDQHGAMVKTAKPPQQ